MFARRQCSHKDHGQIGEFPAWRIRSVSAKPSIRGISDVGHDEIEVRGVQGGQRVHAVDRVTTS